MLLELDNIRETTVWGLPNPVTGQIVAGESDRFVVGLHLRDQLGVASLRLDDGGDLSGLAARVA